MFCNVQKRSLIQKLAIEIILIKVELLKFHFLFLEKEKVFGVKLAGKNLSNIVFNNCILENIVI